MAALDQVLLQRIINCEDPKDVYDDFSCRYDNSVYPEVYRNLLLCASIQYGHEMLINRLLLDNESLARNELSFAASRPLHTAVMHGSFQLVQQLLQCGLDVHEEGASGIWRPGDACMEIGTPLSLAIQKDDPQMMKLLVGYYHTEKTRQKLTPLHYACKYNALKCFATIMEKGVSDLNSRDDQGTTPLMYAVKNSAVMVMCLLKHGADANAAMYKSGYTALHLAVVPSRENCFTSLYQSVKLLVDAGADVTKQTVHGDDTPLTLLCGNLFPMAGDGSSEDSMHHNKEVMQVARCLIKAGALKSSCKSNPITIVLLKMYSLSGTLSYGNNGMLHQETHVSAIEDAFILAKDLIYLLLEAKVEVNTCENKLGKTAAALALWIIDSRTRQTWLPGNTILPGHVPELGFTTNMKLNNIMLDIFTRLLLCGSKIACPHEFTCLFSLPRVDYDRFMPFLLRFLNTLTHKEWIDVTASLALFIKEENMAKDEELFYKSLTHMRTLRQVCSSNVIMCAETTHNPVRCIEQLPLPTTIKENMLILED